MDSKLHYKHETFLSNIRNIRIFALLKQNIVIMKNIDFPSITTVVQAEPWGKEHIAHITPFRPLTNTPKQHHIIEANILPNEHFLS